MVNEDWLCNFGKTLVDFSPCGVSDHSSAMISIGTLVSFGPKPFKFYNYWLESAEFMVWLSDCWGQSFQGFLMFRLYRKLKAFKAVLKVKTLNCYGNLKGRVNHARACLELAQLGVLESNGSANSLLKERESFHVYVSISKVD
jgi:hypothetical protein